MIASNFFSLTVSPPVTGICPNSILACQYCQFAEENGGLRGLDLSTGLLITGEVILKFMGIPIRIDLSRIGQEWSGWPPPSTTILWAVVSIAPPVVAGLCL